MADTNTFAQTLRLIWIDAVITEDGEINRSDIMRAFLVSTPQASADLARFQRLYPRQVFYDRSAKCYRGIEGAQPVYNPSAHRAAFDAVQAVLEVET